MKPFVTLLSASVLLLVLGALASPVQAASEEEKARNAELLKKAFDIGRKAVKANQDISRDEEVRLGEDLAAKLLGAAPLVDNAALQRYVNNVGLWIALQSERPDLPWRFGVIADDDVNAFSMPGGIVLVTSGMYRTFRNESELAGVLAHEISHVVGKHQLRQIQKAAGNEWKADLLTAVAEEKGNRDAKNIAKALTAGIEVYTRGLDKQDEYGADRAGVVLAARAGYNPYGLVNVLLTLGAISDRDSKVALMFQTHPAPLARQDMLAEAMGETLDAWAGGKETTPRFIALKK